MLLASQAEPIILNLVQPFSHSDIEEVPLLQGVGRILAEPVLSSLDFPHWDNSAMDGYAVRYEDVQNCSPQSPVSLHIIEEIPAGYQPQRSVQSGQAARILTGSMMPDGADTVVMQEATQREGEVIRILDAPKPQAFVRHQGAFYQAGTPLLSAGSTLQAPEIAVLAAAQTTSVKVYRRPRVAILSTGDELTEIDQLLQPGKIVDSNRYALAALLAQAGMAPLLMGIVKDDPNTLRQAIAQAVSVADVVLSSGGVSVGDYDYVDEILAELNARIYIRAVAVKPGKPLTVASFHSESNTRSIPYFGLPGNPVSALVTFWRFVQPALRKLSGVAAPWEPQFVTATTRQSLKSDGKRETYLWGKLQLVSGHYEFDLAGGSHSSGNLINLAGTNGLAVIPINQTLISEGDPVQVMQVI